MFKKTSLAIDCVYLCLLLLVMLLNWPRLLPLMINADSYAILLGAEFVKENGSLAAQLGMYGDWFSPLFYRGGFSLLIYLLSFGGYFQFPAVAQTIVQVSFVGSIITIYWLGRQLFRSRLTGFLAAVLMALSYSFHGWSQVIMPEVPTIFLVTLSLVILAHSRGSRFLHLLAALIFGVAMCFRLEMSLVLLISLIWIYCQNKKIGPVLTVAIFSTTIWLIFAGWLYFSNPAPDSWLTGQLAVLTETLRHHHIFLYFVPVGLFVLLLVWRWPILALPLVMIGYLIWPYLNFDLAWSENFPPWLLFVKHELLIFGLGVTGMVVAFKSYSRVIKFLLISGLALLVLYFPRGEFRYYVHLLWLLALPAGYLLAASVQFIFQKVRPRPYRWLLAAVLLFSVISNQFLLLWQPAFLPDYSYEQKVIDATRQVIADNKIATDNLIICSLFSEAMYYRTRISVRDCFNGTKDLSRSYGHPTLLVVDEDISRHQSVFVDLLSEYYSEQQMDERWIVTPYQEKNSSTITRFPVKWYLIR